MCLIFFAINQHPDYKLILAANRDEFYNRKTALANFWPNHPNILGGCDLEAAQPDGTCGTWMAMSKNGRLAFVTNYRDPQNINPKAPSRGQLVTDFLLSDISPSQYLNEVNEKAHQYNGFNLVVGHSDELWYFSNYEIKIKTLSTGLYGLSNHLLDTPWPKVVKGKAAIAKEIHQSKIDIESIFSILNDEAQASDNNLPDTGIGIERERALSSMFIKTNGYGTRCSTVILVKHNGESTFHERTYNPHTFTFETNSFELKAK